MALDPLAAAADLTARNITVPAGMDADTLLASASSEVRDAAGCAISEITSTVDLTSYDTCSLELPGPPVTEVASVDVEGVTLAPSTLVNGCWSAGWRFSDGEVLFVGQWFTTPATVTVTYTHGLAEVPADIVDLVCGMVSIAAAADGDYGQAGRAEAVRLGDYSEKRSVPEGTESPSPMRLPDRTRESLRARFGGNVATLRTR